jgi:glucosamine--fructose-6-phosphate aminotransferase (isomerizing)
MTDPGQHTLSEILSQPNAWRATLQALESQRADTRQFLQSGKYDSVLITGCGSPYYLAQAAATAYQELLSIPARGVPASEVWLNPQAVLVPGHRTLLIVVSRSGETTEVLRACETFKARANGDVVTITCYPDSRLTRAGTRNLVLTAGQEFSVAQTRAFTTLYLGCLALAVVWASRDDLWAELLRLPYIGETVLRTYHALAQQYGSDPDLERFYFLGSGTRYGLACELSLKMKEMSLSHSEPFHFLEFRHGPQSMVNNRSLVVGLTSGDNESVELEVLQEMRALGAKVVAMGESQGEVRFESAASDIVRSVLGMTVGQMIAFYRAVTLGQNPDRPHNLTAVVRLD